MKPFLLIASLICCTAAAPRVVGPCDAQSYTMQQEYSYSPSFEETDDSDQLLELNKIPDLATCPCGKDCQCTDCDASCPCYSKPTASVPEKSIVVRRSKLFRGSLLRRIFHRR